MMFLYAILFSVAVLSSTEATLKNYTHEVLKDNLDSPFQLAVDYKANTLYFSYSVKTGEVSQLAHLNLKTREFGTIPNLHLGFASAVDNKKHKVYLGAKGIYEFDPLSKTAVNLNVTNKTVWQLYSKDDLYFTSFDDEAYVYNNGKVTTMSEFIGTKVRMLAIDNKRNIFYANEEGLQFLEHSTKNVINLGDYVVNGFHSDINGHIYFSTPNGIYRIKDTIVIEQLYQDDENNIFGVATEADGTLIMASYESIIRLK